MPTSDLSMQQKAVQYGDKPWAPGVAPSCGQTDHPLLFPSASDLLEGAHRLCSHPTSHPTHAPGRCAVLHNTIMACPGQAVAQPMAQRHSALLREKSDVKNS